MLMLKNMAAQKLQDLTNDQLNTEIGRISKITKDAGLIPKDGITLKEFSKDLA